MGERIGRLSYLLNSLHILFSGILLFAGLMSFLMMYGFEPETIYSTTTVFYFGYLLVTMIYGLNSAKKRFHDLNHPTKYVFLLFVPIINFYWWLTLLIRQGDKGENDFGDLEPDFSIDGAKKRTFILGVISVVSAAFFLFFGNSINLARPVDGKLESAEISEGSVISSSSSRRAAPKKIVNRPLDREYIQPEKLSDEELAALEQRKENLCDGELSYAIGELMIRHESYDHLETFSKQFEKECGNFLQMKWLVYKGVKLQRDFKQAERLVSELIADDPKDKDYYSWRGLLYQEYKFYGKAVVDFKSSIKLVPKLKSIPLNMVQAYISMKDYCSALKAFETYRSIYPSVTEEPYYRKMGRSFRQKCMT